MKNVIVIKDEDVEIEKLLKLIKKVYGVQLYSYQIELLKALHKHQHKLK